MVKRSAETRDSSSSNPKRAKTIGDKVYVVMREPDYVDGTGVQGIYDNLAEANKAVRDALLSEWERDYFEEYEEEEDKDGKVSIHSVTEEGDVMDVYIVVKDGGVQPEYIKAPVEEGTTSGSASKETDLDHVYLVMAVGKDGSPSVHSVHASAESANRGVSELGRERGCSMGSIDKHDLNVAHKIVLGKSVKDIYVKRVAVKE